MSVIRVFSFSAARRGFDSTLRDELIPDMLEKPGIVDCYVGRRGEDDLGPRVVASVWDSREAMVDAVSDGLGAFHPEHLDATTDQVLEIVELRVAWKAESASARILRVLRGEVTPGELEVYADEVRLGVDLDTVDDDGPTALYLGRSGDDAFVTVSAWREWSHIEAATGGDIRHPDATRHSERLVTWAVELFEIVQR